MSAKITYQEGSFINGILFISDAGIVFDNKQSKHYGNFKCQYCGREYTCLIDTVKRRSKTSCGCMKGSVKHHLTKHKLHTTWMNIINRCKYPSNKCYRNYGGRGIKVCKEWQDDFMNFYNWAINNGYDEKLFIDRIDNDGDYSPSNCRFVTREIQNRNRRRSIPTKYPVGIHFHEKRKKWYSQIGVNGKNIYLGSSDSMDEAIQRRKNYIIENNLIGFINGK